MKTIDINTSLIEGYLRLLNNLSPKTKLELVSKLTLSAKSDDSDKKEAFYKSFGAWESEQSAEEIIKQIHKSRIFNRQTEKL